MYSTLVCRSPYGERGLKYLSGRGHSPLIWSLSLRRAWIEINLLRKVGEKDYSRSPYGERGLKYHQSDGIDQRRRRSPYGERGLKYQDGCPQILSEQSLSLRRAWIEIPSTSQSTSPTTSRSPYGERGLKYQLAADGRDSTMSLSLRRAWIEITSMMKFCVPIGVALLTESVD